MVYVFKIRPNHNDNFILVSSLIKRVNRHLKYIVGPSKNKKCYLNKNAKQWSLGMGNMKQGGE